jgi:hypothetical protein
MTTPLRTIALVAGVLAALPARADADPVQLGWNQTGGPGTPLALTYSYSNLLDGGFNSSLAPTELRRLTDEALATWAAYVPISFHEVVDSGPLPGESEYPSVPSDIRIGYMPRLPDDHVAHVHQPYERGGYLSGGLAGDMHFSNDPGALGKATWGYGAANPLALDFFSVMLHEVGHALGIPHLSADGAVMGTRLVFFAGAADLQAADIAAIRALYGSGAGGVYPLASAAPLPTPEPRTWLLIASGMALLFWRSYERRAIRQPSNR